MDPSVASAFDRAAESIAADARGDEMSAAQLQDLMWQDVGLFRDATPLARAVRRLDAAWHQAADGAETRAETLSGEDWRVLSLVTVGRLIARAALRRQESRGAHFRLDYPERDDRCWQRRIMETRG
jgi:succinate dehydrogenase/fumarate reductase flavoprotein subunit